MHSREKSKRLWFCSVGSLRWRRRHGQPEAEDSIRRLPIPRLVIVIYALCGRSTSGSTRTRSKCSGPPGLVEPHGHCITQHATHTHDEHAHAYGHDPSHTATSMSSRLSLLARERAYTWYFNYRLFISLSSCHKWTQLPREISFSVVPFPKRKFSRKENNNTHSLQKRDINYFGI